MAVQASQPLPHGLTEPRTLMRRGLIAVVLIMTATTLCLPMVKALVDIHSQRVTLHMREMATQIPVPAGLTTLSRGECPSQEDLIGCWTSPRSPDELAPIFTAALRQATGHHVASHCDTSPYGIRARSCLIRYGQGTDHALMVSIDTNAATTGGKTVAAGARIRIDAN